MRLIPPRPAALQDAADIARIHCAAWHKTFAGLFPDAEIAAASDLDRRHRQWQELLVRDDLRIAMVDGYGFSCMGPQRDNGLRGLGYSEELWAIYLLKAAQGRGVGRALLRTVMNEPQAPFSTLVLAGNMRATRFYQQAGAKLIGERAELVGATPVAEQVFGWSQPL